MHRRGVERVAAANHPQKAGGLFEGFVAQAGHGLEGATVGEGAIAVAMGDDVVGERAVEAGDAAEQGGRGGIYVHTHCVHAVFDDGVEHARQTGLVDVVLVLADADGFRVDLDQFGQRILQATADRGSAAQTHIQIGKFSGRQRGGGIHRGAGFGDHHFGQLQLGVAFDQLGGEAVGLA